MTDQLATLQAAEAAGATIQAYTIPGESGALPLYNGGMVAGYWRDLEGPVQWSCHPSRYRIKPEGEA